MEEYFGRCERYGGTQNIAGDPCFFSRGELKNPVQGDFHGVCSRGVYLICQSILPYYVVIPIIVHLSFTVAGLYTKD